MWYFFTNPHIGSQTWLTIWAALALCALNTAYTIVNIPYSSLTPELTKDYHERTSLNGYRFGFAVIGTILGAGAVLPLVGLFGSDSIGGLLLHGRSARPPHGGKHPRYFFLGAGARSQPGANTHGKIFPHLSRRVPEQAIRDTPPHLRAQSDGAQLRAGNPRVLFQVYL